MFERHITVPVEDLRFLELYCRKCGNGVLLDLDTRDPKAEIKAQSCPCCSNDNKDTGFDADFFKEFKTFREALRRRFPKPEVEKNFRGPQFRLATLASAQPDGPK